MSQKRNLKPVRNNPGIYKVLKFNKLQNEWIDTGRFLATRRVMKDGKPKRESSVFFGIPEARDFRTGRTDKVTEGRLCPRIKKDEGMSFAGLLEEWKAFHFLKIELGTRKLYERKLCHLRFLEEIPVDQIRTSTIDELVKLWMNDYPQRKGRQNFDKE